MTASPEFVAALALLSEQAQQQVAGIAAAYEAGAISTAPYVETCAAAVFAANVRATAFADTAVAAWRLAKTGLPTPTLGLTPPDDEEERLVRAFATVAGHMQGMSAFIEQRSTRIAKSEPLQRGHRAYQEALRERGVEEWKRVVMPDACEVCAPLAGKVYPMDHDFTDHPQCRCTLAPMTGDDWASRQRREQLQLRRTWDTPLGQVRFSAGINIQ